MNEFKTYHPIVNFTYFLFVIGFSMILMHPVCMLVSLLSALIYSAVLGKSKKRLSCIIPMILIMALINPLFNHEGVTVLGYFPSGNPFTLESVIYGIAAAVMIVSVICWFSCYNEVMTSDKFIYLFGRIIPSLSLVFSMTLRFVPKFVAHMKTVINAQKCMGKDISGGNIIKRAKNGILIMSIMITWSLENAIETADSMKSRGYGLRGRTAFSVFTFSKKDKIAFFTVILSGIYVAIGVFSGVMHVSYFPSIKMSGASLYEMSCFLIYTLMCIYPVLIEIAEVRRWKTLKSKI